MTLPQRVIIDAVRPEVDCGAFPIKRVVGERVDVEAHVFADGHDALCVTLLARAAGGAWWRIAMEPRGNDVFTAWFPVDALAPHAYTVEAFIDEAGTWHRDLAKKIAAGQDVTVDLQIGAALFEGAAARAAAHGATPGAPPDGVAAASADAAMLSFAARDVVKSPDKISDAMLAAARAWPDPRRVVRYARELGVDVERVRARFSSWYELFPRSTSPSGGHGTLKDCAARLPYVKELGFDVVYLPPIHPIGVTARKGKDNAEKAEPGDVGSPWAIGAAEGGHDAVHPQLGTVDDLRALLATAKGLGLEVALDLAFQCAPDHPWVKEHPQWFRRRPDGTVQYAENPPKKYQDIYPLELDGDDWQALWQELLRVVLLWVDRGVRIFRVDNPHTKPFAFWQWLIAEVKKEHPDVFFLAEAFTRPKPLYRLAKLGFSQSYNYFPWRNTKEQLVSYFEEVTRPPVREYFRPNLWPNTPDILPERLQMGGRAVFVQRLVLAATLGASYGIYGPAFELCESTPREPGAEEYARSEKYEIKHWDLDAPHSIRDVVARINRIRRDNPALQRDDTLSFVPTDNEQLLAYVKHSGDNVVLVAVNLDPDHVQSGFLHLPAELLGLDEHAPLQAWDLLGGGRYLWSGARNYVEIDPQTAPAQIFRLLRKVRSERDFDYYL